MKIRQLAAAAVTAAGVALAFTTPAAAATPTFGALVPSTFVVDYHTDNVPESGTNTATAPCPAGMAVVSVGGLGFDELTGLTPGTTYTSAVATGSAGRGNRSGFVEAQTTCAPNAQFAGSTVATRQQSVHSPLGEWTATVTCPAGMRGFAGGGYFQTRSGTIRNDAVVFMSANSLTTNGRGWTVSAVNQTFTDRLVVTTRCLPQSSSTVVKEETYPFIPVAPGAGVGRANGYAHCPAGYLPISGGATITQDGSPEPSQSSLGTSVLVDNGQIGWFGSGISGGEHAVLHVVALCGR